jgi:hypothetical protein
MAEFMESIKQLFIEKLRTDKSKMKKRYWSKPTIYYLQNTVLPQHQESTINKK